MADITTQRSREELQSEAVQALLKDHFVQVNWGTGVGKSRVAIRAIKELFAVGKKRILLLVGESAHKDNWKAEFIETYGEKLGGALFEGVTIECYASLFKYEHTQWDAIIADEAHHLRSETRVDLISTLKADYFLCLSATLSCKGDAEDLKRTLEMSFGLFTELNFGVQDAIDNGILGKPRIYVHVLPLEDLKKPVSIQECWGRSDKRQKISCKYEDFSRYTDKSVYPDMDITFECTPAQAYAFFTGKMDYWKRLRNNARDKAGLKSGEPDNEDTKFFTFKYLHYCSMRKTLIGHVKTTFAKSLIGRLGDKKYICFCSDVQQGLEIGGDHVIYADRSDGVDNMDVIRDFNEDKIRSLFAVNMIQEGQNLAGIQAGVIIQLSSKDRQFAQKFGRALRSRTPEQHIIVINGTRDIDYLKEALSGLDKSQRYIEYLPYGSLKDWKKQAAAKPAPKAPAIPGTSPAGSYRQAGSFRRETVSA